MYLLKWPDASALTKWRQLFKLGLPTYLLQVSTFISTEIVILMTGYLGTRILVANTGMLNIFYLLAIVTLCIQIISGALIGNKVGEADLDGVRKMTKA